MIAWLTLALVLPAATGYLLCSAFWRRSRGLADWLVKLFVGFGVGVGLSSCTLFLGLLTGRRSRTDLLLYELLIFGAAVFLAMRSVHSERKTRDMQTAVSGGPIAYILAIPLLLAIRIAVRYSVRYATAHPHGDWDSWGIWTMRARFLFRSGAEWRNAFSPILMFSHPDYPILLPATIDRLWTYMQREVAAIPMMLGLFFMLCTVGLAMSGMAVLRSTSQAFLLGGVLVSTPFFLRHAVSGYAEPPLTFFMLATTVLLLMSDYEPRMFVLAGLTAALAAWTKNEGLLFLVCVCASLTLLLFVGRGWSDCLRAIFIFLAGALPVVVVIILFKSQIHAGNWLLAPGPAGVSIRTRLADMSRYSTISNYYLQEILRFGKWRIPMVPVLAIYSLLVGPIRGLRQKPGLLIVMVALALTFIGDFFVYVITPLDLQAQLVSSLNRILLQLWPAAVAVLFCLIRTPEEALAAPFAAR